MIRATAVRALVLAAAFAAGLTPVTCLGGNFGENSNPLPAKATKELPPELPRCSDRRRCQISPIVVRVFKEEAELEVWKQDVTGHSRSSRPIRSVGGRGILGQSCRRATVRLRRASIQLHPS